MPKSNRVKAVEDEDGDYSVADLAIPERQRAISFADSKYNEYSPAMMSSNLMANKSNRRPSARKSFDEDAVVGDIWERLGTFGQLINPNGTLAFGRKVQVVQAMFVALIALAAIVVQIYTDVEISGGRQRKASSVKDTIKIVTNLHSLVKALRDEGVIFYLYSSDSYDAFLPKAQGSIRNTDSMLMWMDTWPTDDELKVIPFDKQANISSISALTNALRVQRNLRKSPNATSELDILGFYQVICDSLTRVARHILLQTTRFPGWFELLSTHHLIEVGTQANRLYEIGRKFLVESRNVLTDPVRNLLIEARVSYEELFSLTSRDSSFVRSQINNNYTQQDPIRAFTAAYSKIAATDYQGVKARDFDDSYAQVRQAIEWIQTQSLDRARSTAAGSTDRWGRNEITSTVLVILACIVSFVVTLMHYQSIRRLQNQVIDSSRRAEMLLKAMNVIYDFVPRDFVRSVKRGMAALSAPRRAHDLCVVLMDINSAALLEEMDAAQFLQLIEKYFVTFEEAMAKYNCFKIAVIGDACCIGAGAGESHSVDHVMEMVFFILELKDRVAQLSVDESNEQALSLRVGMHVGPGISQVLQLQVPRLCVFGEAIELATLIHATSLPARVQTTEAVYDRLINCADVAFNKRGTLSVQGRFDEVVVYWASWSEDEDLIAIPDAESRISSPTPSYERRGAPVDPAADATEPEDDEPSFDF